MKKTNVLVFPAGAENALEIFDALNDHMDIEVYGASGKSDFASFLYPSTRYAEDHFYITDPNFMNKFNALLERWNIDVIIPTHDDIALFFSKNREKFRAKILISEVETAEICREKEKIYKLFSDCSFCPTVWYSAQQISNQDYPIFAKPNIGAGAQNTHLIYTPFDMKNLIESGECTGLIYCEYLPGKECTLDCYTNAEGKLIFSGARSRDRIQNGIAVRSTTFTLTEEMYTICNTINSRMKFFGAWYLQLKEDRNGKWKLLEVSCRQAGGMTLYRHKGINFPMLGIYELNGITVSAMEMPGQWVFDRRLTARFQLPYQFETVYVDLDDTLIVKGQVNSVLMSFLYQCVNEGKKIILLTRHTTIPVDTLKKYRIASTLFDEIIHISFNTKKSDYILDINAIFIDNSFSERKQVYESSGIPVFDVDAVDCLIHYKQG